MRRKMHRCRGDGMPALHLFSLLISTIVGASLAHTVGHRNILDTPDLGQTVAERLSPADITACPKLRIAIVNQVLFHVEVLAGLLYLFDPIAQQTDVFIHQGTPGWGGVGAWDILKPHNSKFYFLNSTTHELIRRDELRYELVILVSPEYDKEAIQGMLAHMRPRIVVVYVHNIGSKDNLDALVKATSHSGGQVKVVTLSPHTSELLKTIIGQPVDSVLAVYPFNVNRSCDVVPESEVLGGCLRGFCVQGTLEGSRRGYGTLWAEVKARSAELTSGPAAQLFHVNVVGKGNRSVASVPEEMQHLVTVSTDVPFPAFYDTIHHSLAIVPALSNGIYLRNKFTSSVLSSLITSTPLIANHSFLFAYQMLSEESVYVRNDFEKEIDTMLRVVNLPVAKILAVRRSLMQVRRRVNMAATVYFGKLLSELCSSSSGL